jgi:hypothetical protein
MGFSVDPQKENLRTPVGYVLSRQRSPNFQISKGAAWLRRVRHGSVGCGMAQQGAAWLSRVRHGSEGCGMAQLRVRHGSVRVRHGSVGSMSARCKAGPSSNPDSEPQGGACH